MKAKIKEHQLDAQRITLGARFGVNQLKTLFKGLNQID